MKLNDQDLNKVKTKVWATIRYQELTQAGIQIRAQVGIQVMAKAGTQIWNRVWTQVRNQVYEIN